MPVRMSDIVALQKRVKEVEKAARVAALSERRGLDGRLFPTGYLRGLSSGVWYEPLVGNTVPIFNGSEWVLYEIAGGVFADKLTLSMDPDSGHTNYNEDLKNYDVFAIRDESAGLTRLATGPKWDAGSTAGSDNQRGEGAGSTWLELFDGIVVNGVEMVCRYGTGANDLITVPPKMATNLGTVRCVHANPLPGVFVAGAPDLAAQRFCWNRYNRIPKQIHVSDATASWNYSTNSWRRARNSSANRVEIVNGDLAAALAAGGAPDQRTPILDLTAYHHVSNSTSTFRNMGTGIGLDSTTVNSAQTGMHPTVGANRMAVMARYIEFPNYTSPGYHAYNWLEHGSLSDTQTWYGQSAFAVSGLNGFYWC